MPTQRHEKRIIVEYHPPGSQKFAYYACWAVDSDDAREQCEADHPGCQVITAFGFLAAYPR